MTRRGLMVAAVVLAAGPATAQQVPGIHAANASPGAMADGSPRGPTTGVQVPTGEPPPIPLLPRNQPLRPREQRNVGIATRWRTQACTPARQADGTLLFRQGACEITIVASPFRVTDVALEPGEQPTSLPVVADERIGLQKQPGWSGSGARQTLHLMFTPQDNNLASGVVIQTTFRTVSFVVVSRAGPYMPLVQIGQSTLAGGTGGGAMGGWEAAAAMGRAGIAAGAAGSGDPCDQPPSTPPSSFRIAHKGWGGAPLWQPLQVYAVQVPAGAATCVEFPADIQSLDAPTLIPRDRGKGAAGVENVRVRGRRYRIDRLLREFELVGGPSGSERVTVTLAR